MVNLTTLAPEIVATIIDETLASEGTQSDLAVAPPPLWQEQRTRFHFVWKQACCDKSGSPTLILCLP